MMRPTLKKLRHWSSERTLTVLLISVLLDFTGVGIIVPLLPFYATSLGADATMFGIFSTVYGISQMLGGPIMGRVGDQFGRRTVLLLSFSGAAIGYLGVGLSTSLWWLMLSRIPVGLMKQTMSVSKAFVAELASPSNRAKTLGYVRTAAGIGFIIGPILAGVFSKYDSKFPAFFASFLFIVDVIFVLIFIPQPSAVISVNTMEEEKPEPKPIFSLEVFSKKQLNDLFFGPFGLLFIIHFWTHLAHIFFHSNLTLYTQTRYGLDPSTNSYLFSYMSLLDVISQTFIIGTATKKYSEQTIVTRGILVNSVAFFLVVLFDPLWTYALALIPLTASYSVSMTCLSSLITKVARKQELGVTVGLSDSLESFCRILAPAISGFFLSKLGHLSLPAVAGSMLLGLYVYVWKRELMFSSVVEKEQTVVTGAGTRLFGSGTSSLLREKLTEWRCHLWGFGFTVTPNGHTMSRFE
ncbi:major facilitator transporter [Planoprotostelium fungivorum]|uniref:Major facilitator transporter n=1 Tax=Planoprotostelium fungivorum TaxID=1890364 RepID=A0A2P6NTQ8_9EUKA|nr:major facilitator transporter [Planoprotostelium fungivorum]